MIIDQEEYAKKIVKRFGMENAKSVRTPLPTGYSPDLNSGNCTSQQRTYYQSIIGSLLYLALGTRPDICYAVILMSQFSVNPSEDHIQKALHIIKYVGSTLSAKIIYNGINKDGFIAYADSDWAGDHITRRSTSGNVVMLAGGAVTWVSRKQKTVAQSSTEAEYISMSDTCRQLVWIQSLLGELNMPIKSMDLCGDNQGAIFSASNPVQETRTKHIDTVYATITSMKL